MPNEKTIIGSQPYHGSPKEHLGSICGFVCRGRQLCARSGSLPELVIVELDLRSVAPKVTNSLVLHCEPICYVKMFYPRIVVKGIVIPNDDACECVEKIMFSSLQGFFVPSGSFKPS